MKDLFLNELEKGFRYYQLQANDLEKVVQQKNLTLNNWIIRE